MKTIVTAESIFDRTARPKTSRRLTACLFIDACDLSRVGVENMRNNGHREGAYVGRTLKGSATHGT